MLDACRCVGREWMGVGVWMWVGCPCPPVRNDIVTPRHLLVIPAPAHPQCCPYPPACDYLIYKAAIIFGFFGMLRFGTLSKLTPQSITLIFVVGT